MLILVNVINAHLAKLLIVQLICVPKLLTNILQILVLQIFCMVECHQNKFGPITTKQSQIVQTYKYVLKKLHTLMVFLVLFALELNHILIW